MSATRRFDIDTNRLTGLFFGRLDINICRNFTNRNDTTRHIPGTNVKRNFFFFQQIIIFKIFQIKIAYVPIIPIINITQYDAIKKTSNVHNMFYETNRQNRNLSKLKLKLI